MKKAPSLILVCALPLFFAACSSEPSLGDQLIAQGEGTRALGEQWNEGNALISEGEKQKKKGRSLIDDGEKLVKKGEKNIERGREMKAAVQVPTS